MNVRPFLLTTPTRILLILNLQKHTRRRQLAALSEPRGPGSGKQ